MRSSQIHRNYVLKLVIGHFSIWVAFVPYHTVMTFQGFTRPSSSEVWPRVFPPPPHPLHPVPSWVLHGSQPWMRWPAPHTAWPDQRPCHPLWKWQTPWEQTLRKGRKVKAVANFTCPWVRCHFHHQAPHWLRGSSFGQWRPPDPVVKGTYTLPARSHRGAERKVSLNDSDTL